MPMIEWAFAAAMQFLWFIGTVITRAVAEVMFGTFGAIATAAAVLTAALIVTMIRIHRLAAKP
jgi:hypothetical protein